MGAGGPVSAARRLHRRRIARATGVIAAGAAVATGVFAAAAAHTTRSASSGSDSTSSQRVLESDGDGIQGSVLTPSQSAPSQSFGPPVARSGGS